MNCKSKTIRALGVRYHRLSGREVIECIEKELAAGGHPLSDAQMSRLKELWDDDPVV